MPAVRNHSASPRKLPHSSDTEHFETPIRRRFRYSDEVSSPSTSSSVASPRKRLRRDSPNKARKEMDLEQMLRDVVAEPTNVDAILALKNVPQDEHSTRVLVTRLIHSAKVAVVWRHRRRRQRLLETELYNEWLRELDYVVSAIEIALNAKQPNTRRRVPGLGRASYTTLFHLFDEFVEEVNAHHDRPSVESPTEPLFYPATMSLVEEAKDPATDARSDKAVALAEAALQKIDSVMALAVSRYKIERGSKNEKLAARIASQEHVLGKGCCLLCEQTGYGLAEDDMGDRLMEETRGLMELWKNEYEEEDCEDQLDASDADS